ncbi:MAG: twin-arginine translocation pathway signal protein [Pseudomonadota bacterium]
MFTRRTILMTGGAAALVGGTAAVGIAHGPGLAKARAPWKEAGESFGDPRLDALAYAILAPNPHNRQPWQFDLVGDDRIDVYVDLDRRLPHTDPFDRQITIGFGCMLELLRIAAAEKGYDVTLTPFPDGEAYPRLNGNRIAQVTFVQRPDLQGDPLFANILARRSTKDPYDTSQPVAQATLDAVIADGAGPLNIGGTIDPAQRDRIIALAWRGFNIEMETDVTRRESVDLMRIGNRAIVENPDGIDMGGIPMGLFKMAGIVSHKGLDTKGSTAYNEGLKMYEPIIHSAQGFVWIKADANTRLTQLQAGQAWVRMNLSAQKAGLCVHPLSQILQEFPEMADPYEDLRAELDVMPDGVVHMLGRVGYTQFPAASPRWPVESKLLNTPV